VCVCVPVCVCVCIYACVHVWMLVTINPAGQSMSMFFYQMNEFKYSRVSKTVGDGNLHTCVRARACMC
jgi:hypothetical protein